MRNPKKKMVTVCKNSDSVPMKEDWDEDVRLQEYVQSRMAMRAVRARSSMSASGPSSATSFPKNVALQYRAPAVNKAIVNAPARASIAIVDGFNSTRPPQCESISLKENPALPASVDVFNGAAADHERSITSEEQVVFPRLNVNAANERHSMTRSALSQSAPRVGVDIAQLPPGASIVDRASKVSSKPAIPFNPPVDPTATTDANSATAAASGVSNESTPAIASGVALGFASGVSDEPASTVASTKAIFKSLNLTPSSVYLNRVVDAPSVGTLFGSSAAASATTLFGSSMDDDDDGDDNQDLDRRTRSHSSSIASSLLSTSLSFAFPSSSSTSLSYVEQKAFVGRGKGLLSVIRSCQPPLVGRQSAGVPNKEVQRVEKNDEGNFDDATASVVSSHRGDASVASSSVSVGANGEANPFHFRRFKLSGM